VAGVVDGLLVRITIGLAGAVASLDEAREIIDRSFPVERFEPLAHDRWDAHHRRFKEYLEDPCA